MALRRYINYFRYVFRHKWYVFLACEELGVPLWMAIFHDWDKFLPGEWIPYARTFRAPDGSKQYKPDAAFERAWLYHKNRNKHHWQFWVSVMDDGHTECLPMPDVHRREMVADWRGAGRALGFPDTRAWYEKNYDNIKLHPDTRAWVDGILVWVDVMEESHDVR